MCAPNDAHAAAVKESFLGRYVIAHKVFSIAARPKRLIVWFVGSSLIVRLERGLRGTRGRN